MKKDLVIPQEMWKKLLIMLVKGLVLVLGAIAFDFFSKHGHQIETIYLSPKTTIILPFAIHRGWDVVAVFVFSLLYFLTSIKNKEGEYTHLIFSIPLGATAGFIFGVVSVLTATSLFSSLAISFLIGAVLITLLGSICKFNFEIGFAIGYSAVIGLVIGIGNLTNLGISGGLAVAVMFFSLISSPTLIAHAVMRIINKKEYLEEIGI